MKQIRNELELPDEEQSPQPHRLAVQEILNQNERIFKAFILCGLLVGAMALVSMLLSFCLYPQPVSTATDLVSHLENRTFLADFGKGLRLC